MPWMHYFSWIISYRNKTISPTIKWFWSWPPEAARRVSTLYALHLVTGTAVMLQDCVYQEWNTKYFGDVLETNANYDPVLATLHYLNETLHWIRRHPAEVNARQEAIVFLIASRTSKLLEFYMYTNIMLSSHFTFLIESYID